MTDPTTKTKAEIHYVIEWFIPDENAIGGKGFWVSCDIEEDRDKAIASLAEWKRVDPGCKYRLLEVQQSVVGER